LVRTHKAGLDSGLVSLVPGPGVGPQQAVYQELGIVPAPLLGREQASGESLLESGQKRLKAKGQELQALRLDVGIGAPHGRVKQVRRNPHGRRQQPHGELPGLNQLGVLAVLLMGLYSMPPSKTAVPPRLRPPWAARQLSRSRWAAS